MLVPQRRVLSLEPTWLDKRHHPPLPVLGVDIWLPVPGLAWPGVRGLITWLLLDASCAFPSMPSAYRVSAQLLDPSSHRELWPPGNCLLDQGFTYCTLFSVPLWLRHRIRHLPLSVFPIVRAPAVLDGPLCASIRLSSMEPQSTVVLGILFQQLTDLPILPGCWLPCHHSDAQHSQVAVCFLVFRTLITSVAVWGHLTVQWILFCPFLTTLIWHINKILTVLKTVEMPLFYLSFVTDFACVSFWGFVCF